MAHLDVKAFEALLKSPAREALPHLLTCARCRRRLNGIFFDLPELEASPVDFGEMTSSSERATTILERAIARLVSEDRLPIDAGEAKLLVEGLLKLDPSARIEAIEAQSRFRSSEMAHILLTQARRTPDPMDSRHLAGLAGAILGFQSGTARRQRVESLASGVLADAERRMGRLELSEDIFKDAASSLRDQPLILEERVVLCRTLAALRQEQGRVDEALGLLEHAATLAEELGADHELALTKLAYGWLLLDEYDAERAILPLQEALSLSEPFPVEVSTDAPPDLYLTFSALHALALAFADLGDDDKLAETYRTLDRLAPHLPDPLDLIRIRWVHARVEARREQHDLALPLLRDIFESFLKSGPGYEAALAALDLARGVVESTPEDPVLSERLAKIAQDLFALSNDQLAPHLRGVLRFALDFPRRRAGAYLDVLLNAAAFIECARFNPSFTFQPTPEPERVMLWRDLTRSQRRQAATSAGVELDHGFPGSLDDFLLISWTHEALTGLRIQVPSNLEDETYG